MMCPVQLKYLYTLCYTISGNCDKVTVSAQGCVIQVITYPVKAILRTYSATVSTVKRIIPDDVSVDVVWQSHLP